jgi:CMP-N,N'-diacetyllegionaminic acid synthase
MRKDTLCIVPARSGSKGIKNKNIIQIKNKPLFVHSLDFAKKLNFVKKTIFTTDSKEYLNIAKKYGHNFYNLRPKKLATDIVETSDVIKYEVANLNKNDLKGVKFILVLQPTCPFRKISDFNEAYKKLRTNYDSVLTIRRATEQPERMMKKGKNGRIYNLNSKVNFKPRQNLQQLYIRAGSMYFFKIDKLKSKSFNIGKKIYGIEVKGKYKVNIDDIEDLNIARKY